MATAKKPQVVLDTEEVTEAEGKKVIKRTYKPAPAATPTTDAIVSPVPATPSPTLMNPELTPVNPPAPENPAPAPAPAESAPENPTPAAPTTNRKNLNRLLVAAMISWAVIFLMAGFGCSNLFQKTILTMDGPVNNLRVHSGNVDLQIKPPVAPTLTSSVSSPPVTTTTASAPAPTATTPVVAVPIMPASSATPTTPVTRPNWWPEANERFTVMSRRILSRKEGAKDFQYLVDIQNPENGKRLMVLGYVKEANLDSFLNDPIILFSDPGKLTVVDARRHLLASTGTWVWVP